eukprot:g40354.t1
MSKHLYIRKYGRDWELDRKLKILKSLLDPLPSLFFMTLYGFRGLKVGSGLSSSPLIKVDLEWDAAPGAPLLCLFLVLLFFLSPFIAVTEQREMEPRSRSSAR